ncbi:hypothetical protein [Rubritalea tangerina]|uniref:hypothetical protein n=1 Tax=Rubritalea tangerina TaxID=430798 RepID=UPI0036179973
MLKPSWVRIPPPLPFKTNKAPVHWGFYVLQLDGWDYGLTMNKWEFKSGFDCSK